jgi:DNA-binding transcriptional LysR family regulator
MLFERNTREVALTPPCELLLRGAGRVLYELESAVDEVRSYAGQVTGRVRLGAWQSMEVRLPDLLAAFRQEYPAVDVAVNEIVSDVMLEAVRVCMLDAAMAVHRELRDDDRLASWPFITGPYDIAVAETHTLAQRRPVRLDELAEEPFIMHLTGSAVRDQILRACADAGFRPHVALETGEMSAARAFVAAGLGITILPRSSLASPGPQVRILTLRPSIRRTSVLVWPDKGPRSGAARCFLEFARDRWELLN